MAKAKVIPEEVHARIRMLHRTGVSSRTISETVRIGRGTILRLISTMPVVWVPRACPMCDEPVPPPTDNRSKNKIYCSDPCRDAHQTEANTARRTHAYSVLRYMERVCPAALKKIEDAMRTEMHLATQRRKPVFTNGHVRIEE